MKPIVICQLCCVISNLYDDKSDTVISAEALDELRNGVSSHVKRWTTRQMLATLNCSIILEGEKCGGIYKVKEENSV